MIIQYPHYLLVETTAETIQDENGNWVEVGGGIQFFAMCREETAGRGGEIQTGGGTFRTFHSLIQLPKGTTGLSAGTHVYVCNDKAGKDVRISGEILKFDVGQLHSRLWL